MDLTKNMELLKKAGYPIEERSDTLQVIGKRYNVPPQRIYQTIRPAMVIPAQHPDSTKMIPASPPIETGILTLADFCAQYNLNGKMVLRELKERGITATADSTLKQIAEQNQTNPIDLYETIKMIAKN